MTDTWLSYSPGVMDANPGLPALDQPVRGYSRAEVDEFLAAVAVERSRLEAEIAEATERINRARSAIGMHRVMVAMLLETQQELSALRSEAEAQARQIVADAEREAAALLGDAPTALAGRPSGDGWNDPFASAGMTSSSSSTHARYVSRPPRCRGARRRRVSTRTPRPGP